LEGVRVGTLGGPRSRPPARDEPSDQERSVEGNEDIPGDSPARDP
jgi:hypothetical protein